MLLVMFHLLLESHARSEAILHRLLEQLSRLDLVHRLLKCIYVAQTSHTPQCISFSVSVNAVFFSSATTSPSFTCAA